MCIPYANSAEEPERELSGKAYRSRSVGSFPFAVSPSVRPTQLRDKEEGEA